MTFSLLSAWHIWQIASRSWYYNNNNNLQSNQIVCVRILLAILWINFLNIEFWVGKCRRKNFYTFFYGNKNSFSFISGPYIWDLRNFIFILLFFILYAILNWMCLSLSYSFFFLAQIQSAIEKEELVCRLFRNRSLLILLRKISTAIGFDF